MRIRTWIFAAVVALVFAINLGLVSSRIAQTGEDTVRARLAQSANGLRAQLELIDARLSPRAAAEVPELADATRSPADPAQATARPDDRALRAAASALAPEPDLLAVVNAQGALVSRRARPAQALDDLSLLPPAKAALERRPAPTFAAYDGVVYRMAAARVPGSGAAVIAGSAADDRLAAQLKSQVDADVTLISNGKVIASSLSGDARGRVLRWAAAPGPGYGVMQVYLPGLGNALSGHLPRGASRYAVRGALVPLDGGLQAALTIPASPYLGWLARYQGFYLLGLLLFLILGFLWGLFAAEPATIVRRESAPAPFQRTMTPRSLPRAVKPSLVGTDIGDGRTRPVQPAGEVPWTDPAGAPPAETAAAVRGAAVAPVPLPAPAPPVLKPGSPDRLVTPADGEPEPTVVLAEIEPSPLATRGADLFTPAPEAADEQSAKAVAAEAFAAGAFAAEPSQPSPGAATEPERAAAVAEPGPSEVDSEPPNRDEGFAHLLDEARKAPTAAESFAEKTSPGAPQAELMARAREEAYERPGEGTFSDFPAVPGGESTHSEPASEEPRDRLRGHDGGKPEDREQAVQQGEPEWAAAIASAHAAPDENDLAQSSTPPDENDMTQSSAPPDMPETAPEAQQFETAPSEAAEPEAAHFESPADPEEPAADPDEAHWQETYDQFIALKEQLGEPGSRMSYEKFAARLAKNRAEVMAKRSCSAVLFSVYEKDGKASIKASAIR